MNTGVPHQESVLKYDDDKSDCFHADVGPSRNNCSTSNNSNDQTKKKKMRQRPTLRIASMITFAWTLESSVCSTHTC